MTRFAAQQPDLFAPARLAEPPPPADPIDPIAELNAMLAQVKAADRPPWPHLTVAIEWEYRALFLARQSGEEGKRLATAIIDEDERLFSAQERAQMDGTYVPDDPG